MRKPIELRSDNAAGVAPEIMEAILAANTGSALAYGGDEWTRRVRDRVRSVFEHPTAEVFPVVSGTAANALGLSALCPPWGSVLCHETSHVLRSECGATSMFAAGAVLRGLPGADYRLHPDALTEAFARTRWGDPHHSQPAVLSLTVPTDHGTIYSPAEIATLVDVARSKGMKIHADGARIANAIQALGCRPAELTWRAGVDVLTLGATKNGTMSADAIVCFDSDVAKQLVYRLKRAGHVPSKMRFQSVQLDTYLTNELWLRLAGSANAALRLLHAGLDTRGIELLNGPEVNMLFARIPPALSDRLDALDVLFYRMAPDTIRIVTSFQTTAEETNEVLSRLDTAMRG